MTELKRRTSTGMGQGRNRGTCRGLQADSTSTTNRQGTCIGSGIRQGRQSSVPPAETVIEPEERFYKTDLQMLKEQAERMTKALKNIQAQIEALTEKEA